MSSQKQNVLSSKTGDIGGVLLPKFTLYVYVSRHFLTLSARVGNRKIDILF